MTFACRLLNGHFSHCRPILDPDGLDIDELSDAVHAELAPIARTLHTAKWEPWVGRHHFVHKDQTGFQLIDEPLALRRVVRPYTAAEAEWRVIGQTDRLIDVRDERPGGAR